MFKQIYLSKLLIPLGERIGGVSRRLSLTNRRTDICYSLPHQLLKPRLSMFQWWNVASPLW